MDIYTVTKSTNVHYITTNPILGYHREYALPEQHIITEAAPNELKLSEDAYSDESRPSARTWRRGCSSGVICVNHLVRSEFLSESGHTHAYTLFEYPPGSSY